MSLHCSQNIKFASAALQHNPAQINHIKKEKVKKSNLYLILPFNKQQEYTQNKVKKSDVYLIFVSINNNTRKTKLRMKNNNV